MESYGPSQLSKLTFYGLIDLIFFYLRENSVRIVKNIKLILVSRAQVARINSWKVVGAKLKYII